MSIRGEGVRKVSPTRVESTRTHCWPTGNPGALMVKPVGTAK